MTAPGLSCPLIAAVPPAPLVVGGAYSSLRAGKRPNPKFFLHFGAAGKWKLAPEGLP
jgi:hypothetical protein